MIYFVKRLYRLNNFSDYDNNDLTPKLTTEDYDQLKEQVKVNDKNDDYYRGDNDKGGRRKKNGAASLATSFMTLTSTAIHFA